MGTLRQILDKAAGGGLISEAQVGPLEAYLAQNGVVAAAPASPSEAAAGFTENSVVDTEVPRFIRGFHDVLITIGVLILLAGVWGLGSVLALLPVIIVLAEILVARQRLALPAVVLSLATVTWAIFTMMFVLDWLELNLVDTAWVLAMLSPLPILMGLFYWRYRVPIGLSILLLSVFAFLLTVLFYLLGLAVGVHDFVASYPAVSAVIFAVSAAALFAVAMRYDLSDPARVTRRSDIAFWLHLAAAPALLYAMLSLAFLWQGNRLFSLSRMQTYDSAGKVLAVVVVLMVIGLIIDRRAFVTSGLVSLIAAIGAILSHGEIGGGSAVFIALSVVGAFVLAIGVGWPQLRRLALGGLPEALKAKLPPLR